MESFQTIAENNENTIDNILTDINFNRTKNLAFILFLANFVFLFVDYINKVKGFWIITEGYKYLFYAHVFIGLVTLLYILVSYRIKICSPNDITLAHKFYVFLFALFILSITAVISSWIDQKIHNQITVYIMGIFLTAIMYYFKPKVTVFLYGLSYVTFMILITLSQSDPTILYGHYLNISLLVVVSYFLSTTLYEHKHRELHHKFNLEKLVTERTKDFQMANDSLRMEILERERTEIKMVKLDKLNLIGEMAASISHEVRNPMTTVKGFLQLLLHKQDSKDKEYFMLMIEELDRANSILSEFLSISRTKPTMFEWQNINDIVTATLPLVRADAVNSDKILTVQLSNVPDLLLNIQEIRQLLLNLVRNGLEAMSSGGHLEIKTFATNTEVALVVSDKGNGIEQHILENLGQPFLTTKEQGTGLGLAVCYSIVSRHNGRISVQTSPEGSAFSVYFTLS